MVGSAESRQAEVVIVGAGPVGLSLALGLARAEKKVLVLEKNSSTAEHSRAPAIWPRTQEHLAELGIIDTFLDEAIIVHNLELWDVDRQTIRFSAPLEKLSGQTPYPHLLILPQSRTEQLLLDAVKQEPAAEVRFSCEVTDVVQKEASVAVHFHLNDEPGSVINTKIVAGCDGAHSIVREKINASFEGETYNMRAALVDIKIEKSDFRFPRLTTKSGIAVGIRIQEKIWRIILPFRGNTSLPLDQRVKKAVNNLFGEIRNYQSLWQSEFQLHRRVSSVFSRGNIILAGDAAHLNSPVGGQGMNAGIEDAVLLKDAIIASLDRQTTAPLDAFAHNRRKEIQQGVNQFTNILTRILFFGGGRLFRPSLVLVNGLMYFPPVRNRILKRLAMLD